MSILHLVAIFTLAAVVETWKSNSLWCLKKQSDQKSSHVESEKEVLRVS